MNTVVALHSKSLSVDCTALLSLIREAAGTAKNATHFMLEQLGVPANPKERHIMDRAKGASDSPVSMHRRL